MKKILNTTRIRRVLTHSFAAALIAKGGFLSTASAKEIVIDFKGGKITEEAISRRLREENVDKTPDYKRLTEKFKDYMKVFSNPQGASVKAAKHDSLEDVIEAFIAVVPGGKALEKRNASSQNNCTLFTPQNTSQDASEPWRDVEIRFLTALTILEIWGKNETCENDATRARAALHAAGNAFYQTVFTPIVRPFGSSEGLKEACSERLESTREAQAEELVLKITLKNGSVDSETSKELFENLDKGLYLTLERIKGTISANEVLKGHLISITFLNSELVLEEKCFQNSKYLEQLIFENSTVTMHYLCFANCLNLKSPEYKNLLLYLPYLSNLSNVFGDDPCINKKFIREMATNCFRERCKRGTFEKEDDVENYLMCNELDPTLKKFYYRCEAEKRYAELGKQLDDCKKENAKFKEKNSKLERANENQSKAIGDLPRQNKRLTEELRTQKEELSKKADKFSKLSAEYERFKKQQTETVGTLKQKLETESNHGDTLRRENVELRTRNKELSEELKGLQTEKEVLKEEIENLQALNEEWKGKIDKATALETENSELKKQLIKVTEEKNEAERKLNKERKQNTTTIQEKNKDIRELKKDLENLRSKLAETQKRLGEAQVKIKELQNSESFVLKTMDMIQDEEEPKEEVKNGNFRFNFSKNTFQQKQNTNKKSFYPKNKGGKGGKFVPYNP